MSDAIPLPPRPRLEMYEALAKDFQRGRVSDSPGAVQQWAERIEQRWHEFGKANQSAADAQLFLAQQHGFASWPKFAAHVEALADASTPVAIFEAAVEAIVEGDFAGLQKLVSADPELARARSTREHRSTLLHYVSANGVEDFRQKTPANIVEITTLLLDAGADVNAESDAYGGGSTTLGLVATSVHPAKAGVQIALLRTLLDRGARLEQPSAPGTARSVVKSSLANGQPQAAAFLASCGAPVDLEGAAGLGRLDLTVEYFDENGGLRSSATRQEMESGFLFACRYGGEEVVRFLLEKGVDPGVCNHRGQTGLHCASYGAHVAIIKLLLERGAPLDVRDTAFSATPLDVALWVRDRLPERAERERCDEVIAMLRAADLTRAEAR